MLSFEKSLSCAFFWSLKLFLGLSVFVNPHDLGGQFSWCYQLMHDFLIPSRLLGTSVQSAVVLNRTALPGWDLSHCCAS